MEFLLHLFLSGALLLVVARIIPGMEVEGWLAAILGALVLGIVNAIVRPVAVVLTIPLTIVTLGLFLFVVNALMLKLAAGVVPGFRILGFLPAILGSILFSLMNMLLFALLPESS
ncbi:MAG: phage holin family protein [Bdellovibrionales bacterium]|nr:phage holin family protein [Bdellovibrionales bacterium]